MEDIYLKSNAYSNYKIGDFLHLKVYQIESIPRYLNGYISRWKILYVMFYTTVNVWAYFHDTQLYGQQINTFRIYNIVSCAPHCYLPGCW